MTICIQSPLPHHYIHIWHKSLEKYDCHIADMSHLAIMLNGHTDLAYAYIYCNTIKWNIFKHYCHACTNNTYALQMQSICIIYTVVHAQIGDSCISIYGSYELTAINSVTRNPGIHKFHIIGIWLWRNMATILQMYNALPWLSTYRPDITT